MTIYISGTTGISGVDGSAGTPAVQGTDTNTGVFYPAADTVGVSTGGSERMRVDSSGNVGIGTSSPNANSKLDVAGISQSSNASYPAFQLYNSGLASNAYFRIAYDAANNLVFNNVNNAYNSSTEFMRINSSGNVLVTNPAGLGYGTGSGGTVTQATSKSTAVTLNKPTGQITMNNAALAANTTVNFILNNTLLGSSDVMTINIYRVVGSSVNYLVWADSGSGSSIVNVRNISAGSLSDALVLNFAIIKGATS